MNSIQKVNYIRKKIMQGLTRNIGASSGQKPVKPLKAENVKRILISRPNHRLGNLLLLTPLLQEITNTFPDCKIDLFVRGGLAPIVFKNYKNVDTIIQLPKKPFKHLPTYIKDWVALKRHHYNIVINVAEGSSSGRLSVQFTGCGNTMYGNISEPLRLEYNDYIHMAKYPVYNVREYLTQAGINVAKSPVKPLDLMLDTAELEHGKKLLESLITTDREVISIFTYATGNKCYSETWWAEFYAALKTHFPDYNLLEILPVENVSQIGFDAPSFYSKDVREIGAVIAATAIFIGADSGMMHLAAASNVPVAGLFSVTNLSKYGPYGHNSRAIDTNEGTVEDWIDVVKELLHTQVL